MNAQPLAVCNQKNITSDMLCVKNIVVLDVVLRVTVYGLRVAGIEILAPKNAAVFVIPLKKGIQTKP